MLGQLVSARREGRQTSLHPRAQDGRACEGYSQTQPQSLRARRDTNNFMIQSEGFMLRKQLASIAEHQSVRWRTVHGDAAPASIALITQAISAAGFEP